MLVVPPNDAIRLFVNDGDNKGGLSNGGFGDVGDNGITVEDLGESGN